MSKTKTLTASEQAALLRYASALPVESDMRKVIVAAVSKTADSSIPMTDLLPEQQKVVDDLSRVFRMKPVQAGTGSRGYYVVFSGGRNHFEAKDLKMLLSFGVRWIEWGQFLAVGL